MEAIKATLAEVKRVVLEVRRDVKSLVRNHEGLGITRDWDEVDSLGETISIIARPVTATAIRFTGDVKSARQLQRLIGELSEFRIEFMPTQSLAHLPMLHQYMDMPATVMLVTPLGDEFELPEGFWVVIDDDRTVRAYDEEHMKIYFAPKGI